MSLTFLVVLFVYAQSCTRLFVFSLILHYVANRNKNNGYMELLTIVASLSRFCAVAKTVIGTVALGSCGGRFDSLAIMQLLCASAQPLQLYISI